MERYIGLDVHATSCTVAVVSAAGKRLRDMVVETNGQSLVEAVRLIPGRRHVVFEEGTQSAWLYEVLSPHAEKIVVAGVGPRAGSKNDRMDAYDLAEQLRGGTLYQRVYKAPRQFTTLRELARGHRMLVEDVVRIQSRIKSVYRSRGVSTTGKRIYGKQGRESWLKKLPASCYGAPPMSLPVRSVRTYLAAEGVLEPHPT